MSKTVAKINELEPQVKVLSDAELKAKTDEFRRRLEAAEKLDDLIGDLAGADHRFGKESRDAFGEPTAPAEADLYALLGRGCGGVPEVDLKRCKVHVSTARSVEIIRRAKDRGVRVTAEATPHHFTLTDEEAADIIVKGRGSHFDPDVVDAFVALGSTFRNIALAYADYDEEREALGGQTTPQPSGAGRTMRLLVAEDNEINREVADAKATLEKLKAQYGEQANAVDATDGYSFEFPEWRFNIRMSNTEPVVRLNVETRGDPALLEEKTAQVLAILES